MTGHPGSRNVEGLGWPVRIGGPSPGQTGREELLHHEDESDVFNFYLPHKIILKIFTNPVIVL